MTGATGGGAPTGATGAQGTAGAQGTGATGPTDERLKTGKTTVEVPEKYKNEAWAKEVKSPEDLWDKMNGMQKLIGKDKIALPGDSATKDELNDFYKRMGRPDDVDGYEFKSIESLQEVDRNVDLDKGMKQIFFEEGVSKTAGENVVKKYEALVYDMTKPSIEASAQRNLEFQKLADEVLGEDKAASTEAFKSVMRESLGDKAYLADKIDGMSNEELLPLIVFSKNIHDKYTGENRVTVTPGSQPNLSGDLKTDYRSLSNQKLEVKNDQNMPEHIRKTKLANLNLAMMKIGTKAKDQDIDLFS